MEKDNKKLDRLKNLLAEDNESRTTASMLSRDILYLLQSTMENSGSPKLAKAVAISSAAWTVGTAIKGFWGLYKKSHTPQQFTIKITEDDQIFEVVEDWFLEALPEENQRSVYAHSTVTKADDEPKSRRTRRFGRPTQDSDETSPNVIDQVLGNSSAEGNRNDRVSVNYSFDGTMAQMLTIAGHDVEVYTNVPERTSSSDNGKKSAWDNRSMNIVCKSVEARNAVLAEIEEQSQHLVQSQPRMYTTTRWGDWRRKSEIQPRSRDSVVLKEGQMDRILGYLNNFLANRAAYLKADIPFRTGILLHGEPGSGKSSTALAIANELKMNVYIVSLTSLSSDEALNDCFNAIPSNSIVILEDIDIVSAVKNRDKDDDDHGVTMTGMLNVLDGFQSPPGVITIMTTNRLDVLDDAIYRPGRVDLLENLDCLDDFQLRGLCQYFMDYIPEELPVITPADGVTSAEVMGEIRKHLPEFENAGPDIVKFITDKVLTKLDA